MAQDTSLFGPTAAEVQRQIALEQQQNAFQQATLNPLQYGVFTGARAGQNIGNLLNSVAGVEDPRLTRAKALQAAGKSISETDLEDPEKLMSAVASQMLRAGLPEEAVKAKISGINFNLDKKTKELKIDEIVSKIKENNAQADRASQEKLTNIGRLQKEYTDHVRSGNLVAAAQTQMAIMKEAKPTLKDIEIGVPGQPNLKRKVLIDPTQIDPKTGEPRIVMSTPPYNAHREGALVNIGPTEVNVKNNTERDQAGMKDIIKEEAKEMAKIPTQVEDYNIALNELRNMKALARNGINEGIFSDWQQVFGKTLQALGMSTNEMNDVLGNTEQFTKNAGGVVMRFLGGKLGSGISNQDLAFVQQLVPQAASNPQARDELINYMTALFEYKKNRLLTQREHFTKEFKNANPEDRRFSYLDNYEPPKFGYESEQYRKFKEYNSTFDKQKETPAFKQFMGNTKPGTREYEYKLKKWEEATKRVLGQ